MSERTDAGSLPVFVIHWNAPDAASRAVASLIESSGVSTSITVLDNASERAAQERLRLAVPAEVDLVILEENEGYAGAANEAIARARGRGTEWFAVCAHDVVVRPTTLALLLACGRREASIGVVGPVLMDSSWSVPVSTGGEWRSWRGPRMTSRLGSRDGFWARNWLSGAFLLIRTECATAADGFWSDLFAYCEDVDFCLRARQAGWGVGVCSSALAVESGRSATTERVAYLNARNAIILAHRWGGRRAFIGGLVRTSWHVLRSLGGSVAFWRDAAARDRSRSFFRGQSWAVIDAVRRRLGSGHEFTDQSGA